MKHLKAFVDNHNRLAKIFNGTTLDLDRAADRQRIAEIIDGRLSPENLTCDGELSRTEVNRRYRELTRCAQELLSIDPTVKFYEYA